MFSVSCKKIFFKVSANILRIVVYLYRCFQKAGDGVSSKVYQALQDTYFASSTSEAYLTLAESALKFHHNLAVPVIQAVVGFRTFRHFQLRCDHFGRLCVFSSAEVCAVRVLLLPQLLLRQRVRS